MMAKDTKRTTIQMFHKEEIVSGKAQAYGLYAKQEEG